MKSILAESDLRNFSRPALTLLGAALMTCLTAPPVQAHAFGERYDLPLPLDFYLTGAGGAVALSFVVMALVFRARSARDSRPRIDLLRFRPMRVLIHPIVIGVLQGISVGLFFLVLATGFFGQQDTVENFAPTFVWIIWWVGFAYVAALVGNLWPAVNPWSIIFAGFRRIARRLGPRAQGGLGLVYPSWLGVWPAIVFFALFAWLELVAEAATVPYSLATAILIYSVVTWFGMLAFGRHAWLAHGEAFSLFFAVLGRFAPIAGPRRDAPDNQPGPWYLRPYAGGLVAARPCRLSMTVFVLLMLSTVTFDGFTETPLWTDLVEWTASAPALNPLLLKIHELGFDFLAVFETVMLALFPLLFLLGYLGFCWLAKEVSESERPVTEIAGLFVFSLVPIAIAYHLAHYLSYLLLAGQRIVPLVSDPFGFGWNLFGTADYDTSIGIIGAKFVWYVAVVTIVVGHVFGVGVAHIVALRIFETARAALKSQYPFLVLMIAYTMASLWILSQPLVESADPKSLRASSGTVSLAPYEFRERCLDLTALDEVRYDFQADRPLAFNVHYHDGAAIRYPVALDEITNHVGKFVAEVGRQYCLMWTNESLAKTSLTYRVFGP